VGMQQCAVTSSRAAFQEEGMCCATLCCASGSPSVLSVQRCAGVLFSREEKTQHLFQSFEMDFAAACCGNA
jgi:hypothetical protein